MNQATRLCLVHIYARFVATRLANTRTISANSNSLDLMICYTNGFICNEMFVSKLSNIKLSKKNTLVNDESWANLWNQYLQNTNLILNQEPRDDNIVRDMLIFNA